MENRHLLAVVVALSAFGLAFGIAFAAGVKVLASDGVPFDHFGDKVAISGDVKAVAARDRDVGGFGAAGSVYMFRRIGDTWVEEAILEPSNPENSLRFGLGLAVSGDVVVAGPTASDGAEVFRWDGATWNSEGEIVAANPFGHALGIDGDVIVAGAPALPVGSAYVFRWNGAAWLEEQEVVGSDAEVTFGWSAAIDGDRLVVGDRGPNFMPGAAYVFEWNGATWLEVTKLEANTPGADDYFGERVALDGDRLAVGARGDDVPGTSDGAAYAFERTGGVWTLDERLVAPDPTAWDFGQAVAIRGDVLAVGARHTYGIAGKGQDVGAVYVFPRGPSGWGGGARFTQFDFQAPKKIGLGGDVALGPGTLAVGAGSDDNSVGPSAGALYLVTPFAHTCEGGECFIDTPVDAKKLILIQKPSGEKLTLAMQDDFLLHSDGGDRPDAGGLSIDLLSAAEGQGTVSAPGGPEWQFKESKTQTLLFKNPNAPGGSSTLKKIVLKGPKPNQLKASGKGIPLPMAVSHGEIGVRVVTGSLRMCSVFDADTIKRDLPGHFIAKGAEIGTLANCADASLP